MARLQDACNQQELKRLVEYIFFVYTLENNGIDTVRIFEWDETKRQTILSGKGIDILYAARIFNGEVLTAIDDRADYGEVRFISLGMVEDECFVVVHTERNNVTRLITTWKGGRDERSEYQAGIARRNQQNE